MARRGVRLTVDHVADFPPCCGECLFWELDPVRRARLAPEERLGEKQTWVSGVLREWGSCGQVVTDGDELVGYALYAPAAFVAGAAGFPTAPPSPDAVVLAGLHVVPTHRGGGWGRILVQSMARDLVGRGVVAVETFGDSRRTPRVAAAGDGHSDVLPTAFLSAVGFRTSRPHPTYPRMRMELRSTLTWKDEVEQAIGALLGTLNPVKSPKAARPQVRDGRPSA